MLMVAATPIGARVATPKLTDVELYAWIAQAEAGARLEYHRGFLGIDVTPVISTLPAPERRQLADLGQAALGAFEKCLVHLVQERLDYRSVAEIDRAIEALDREIAAAEGRRIVRQVRVTTAKGL